MTQRVRRSILIYACAFAVAGATPFLLLPLLTQRLTPQQFGQITSFLVFAALLSNFFGLTAHGFVAVRYFKSTSEDFSRLVSSSVAALCSTHFAAAVIVAILLPWATTLLGLTSAYMLLAVPAAFFLSLNLISLAIFQSSNRPLLYLSLRLVQGMVEMSLCVGLIFLVNADEGARIDSYVVAIAVSAMAGLAICKHLALFGGAIDSKHIKSLIAFGFPMLPHLVAGSIITYIDRLLVSSVLGTKALGLYMVAMQTGMAMVALIEPLNKALAPWLFEQLAKDQADIRRMVVKRTYQLFAALIILGFCVAFGADLFFDNLIGADFGAAKPLIPWMVAGFVMQGMYYSVVNYMFYAEKTVYLSMATGTTAAFSCLISYVLATLFGLRGASVSFFLNNTLLFLLVWIISAKAVPMPWRLAR